MLDISTGRNSDQLQPAGQCRRPSMPSLTIALNALTRRNQGLKEEEFENFNFIDEYLHSKSQLASAFEG